jgi:hypothetical protein
VVRASSATHNPSRVRANLNSSAESSAYTVFAAFFPPAVRKIEPQAGKVCLIYKNVHKRAKNKKRPEGRFW